jgi:hypothetical protein
VGPIPRSNHVRLGSRTRAATIPVKIDDHEPVRVRVGTELDELVSMLGASRTAPLDPSRVVHFARRAVPRADDCSLTLVRPRTSPRTMAATGELVGRVDELQRLLGEGPSVDDVDSGAVCRVDDLATDTRWSRFAGRCVEATGVRSLFAVRVDLDSEGQAALMFLAREPEAFDDADVAIAAVFAPVAALVLEAALHAQDAAHLQEALKSSRQIGTAIGILMERQRLTSDAAFALLVQASQGLNRKLRDIAEEVELTGEVPGRPPVVGG